MQSAMVVTWAQPVPGREEKALAYGAEVMEFWGKRASEGKCSPPELFFSERGTGLWMVKGDRDTLLQIHDTGEARLLTFKGELLLEGFCLDFFYAGDAAADYMTRYAAALSQSASAATATGWRGQQRAAQPSYVSGIAPPRGVSKTSLSSRGGRARSAVPGCSSWVPRSRHLAARVSWKPCRRTRRGGTGNWPGSSTYFVTR